MAKSKIRNAQDRVEKKTARVGAFALMFEGRFAGRVVLVYPADGAGRLECKVQFTAGPCGELPALYGKADGYGFDKASAAVRNALSAGSIAASVKEYASVFCSDSPARDERRREMLECSDATQAVITAAKVAKPDGYGWRQLIAAMGYSVEWVA